MSVRIRRDTSAVPVGKVSEKSRCVIWICVDTHILYNYLQSTGSLLQCLIDRIIIIEVNFGSEI